MYPLNRKQHFISALNCQNNAGYPPLWELEFHLWEAFAGEDMKLGEDFARLSLKEKDRALQRNVEIAWSVSDQLGFSGLYAPGNYWEIAPGKPAYYWLPPEDRARQVKLFTEAFGDEILIIVNTGGVLAMPASEIFEEFSIKLFTHPEEIEKLAQESLAKAKQEVDRYAVMGICAFLTASDLADTKSPYFSPDQMERFILPYMHEWAAHIRKAGGYSILHSDGNLDMYMEPIVQTGVNALQAIDPVAHMDIVALQQKYSDRLCLCGNIDVGMLNTATPEKVNGSSKALLQSCGAAPGFVFGASNAIQKEIPFENYQAMVKAYHDYCRGTR